MKRAEIHHSIANEVGIAFGMTQLARQKISGSDHPSGVDKASASAYLDKAIAALERLKGSVRELRDLDSPPETP